MMIKLPNPRFFLTLVARPCPNSANRGWTLIEMIVTVVIIGILAAMAMPSFGRMQARNQLRGAMADVQGAIREAQRNAIKQGSSCTVELNPTALTVRQASSTPGCVSNPVNLSNVNGVSMTVPSSNTDITFTFKGNPTFNSDTTIALAHEITDIGSRCLVISSELGMMRTGNLVGSTCTPDL